jgi:D-glycero-D-manno-heptose 1,7-bisphosphate phosphatase
MTASRPAVFLDRDGTLNDNLDYLIRPEQMRLLPGVGAALCALRAAGFACVVVTNQSAVGRGMISAAELECIHAELCRQLADAGATLDAIYVATAVTDHPDRKPAPGMLLRAAEELNLDLANSWMIGDALRDMQAGQAAGCKGCVLVRSGHPIDEALQMLGAAVHIADDLAAAAEFVLKCTLVERRIDNCQW